MSRSEELSRRNTGSDTQEARSGSRARDNAIRDKELQLQELRHRVKNTMHLLGTLLRRAERDVADPDAKAKIREVANKVAAIGALEQLMYESSSPDRIEMLELTRAVAGTVVALAAPETECEVSGDGFHIKPQAATTVALIINELLTNCFKHAQTRDQNLRIRITVGVREEWLELTVRDNGATSDENSEVSAGSGIALVRGLVHQLGGSFAIDQTEGTRCVVELPAASLS